MLVELLVAVAVGWIAFWGGRQYERWHRNEMVRRAYRSFRR